MNVPYEFKINDQTYPIHILFRDDGMYFQTNEIEKALEMGNIRTSIQKYDETKKVTHKIHLSTGVQYMTRLSLKGLFYLLNHTRKKKNAEKLYEWVCDRIDEIKNPLKTHYSEDDIDYVFTSEEEKESVENEEEKTVSKTERKSSQRHEIIAELNIEKNKILNVYSSQAEACSAMNQKGRSSIGKAIKKESIVANRYWKFYKDCSEEMKQEYLKDNILPEHTRPKGISIEVVDTKTNTVRDCFDSMEEAIRNYHVGRVAITTALKTNKLLNGYLWRYADM